MRGHNKIFFFFLNIEITVQPAYVVTSIKGSPATFSRSLDAKHSANELVLRGHQSCLKQPLFVLPLGGPLRQV